MENKNSNDIVAKQQWRSWPSPMGQPGDPQWAFKDEDILKVIEDDLYYWEYGRQHQFKGKWETNSIFCDNRR